MNQTIITQAAEVVKQNSVHQGEAGFGVCTLSLIDEDGFPTASVVTPAKSDGINWIAFGVMLDGNKAKRAENCNRASACFYSAEQFYCVNLVGETELITSDDVKREMWYDGLAHHFTGPDDPNYGVLKLTTKRYKIFLGGEEVEGRL